MKKIGTFVLAVLLLPAIAVSQEKKRDNGIFVEPKNAFWDEIQKATEEFAKKKPASPEGVRRRPERFRRAQEPRGLQRRLAQPADIAGRHEHLLVLLDDLLL